MSVYFCVFFFPYASLLYGALPVLFLVSFGCRIQGFSRWGARQGLLGADDVCLSTSVWCRGLLQLLGGTRKEAGHFVYSLTQWACHLKSLSQTIGDRLDRVTMLFNPLELTLWVLCAWPSLKNLPSYSLFTALSSLSLHLSYLQISFLLSLLLLAYFSFLVPLT